MTNPRNKEVQTSFLPPIEKDQVFDESLDTTSLQKRLDSVRQSGTPKEVAQTEREIATSIFKKVASFEIGPMGDLLLSDMLLQEVNIPHLINKKPKRKVDSVLVLYSDKTIELLSLISDSKRRGVITDRQIKTKDKSQQITTADIITFAQNDQQRTLTFIFKNLEITVSRPKDKTDILKLHALTQVLRQQGYYEESIILLRKLTKIEPKNDENHNDLGKLLMLFGQDEKAIREFRQAIDINPKNSNAHKNLGDALSKDTTSLSSQEIIETYQEFLNLTKNTRSETTILLRDQIRTKILLLELMETARDIQKERLPEEMRIRGQKLDDFNTP